MAFMMVSSLRMQATITIVITLPALHDALGKGFDHGLQRGTETVAMYKTAHLGASAPDRAPAAVFSAVFGQGSHSCERRNLPAVS
jgi:hypothetical protein